jgi:hypothetical protein
MNKGDKNLFEVTIALSAGQFTKRGRSLIARKINCG